MLLTPPGSLGVLDRAVDRVVALGHGDLDRRASSSWPAARTRSTDLGVSAFASSVTDDVVAAAPRRHRAGHGRRHAPPG